MDTLEELKTLLGQVSDLEAAAALLSWDQETHMPPAAASVRGLQVATVASLAHERFTTPRIEELLCGLEAQPAESGTVEEALVRVTRRDYDRATKIPTEFVEEKARAENEAHHAWLAARKNDDFRSFEPHLEKMFDLARRYADLVGFDDHPYDALLDDYEPGARAAEVKRIFAGLRDETLPLLQAIVAAGDATDYGVLTREFDVDRQRRFALEVAEDLGLKGEFSRLDISAHPFQTNFSRNDIRITTRFDAHYFPMSLFGTWHETGHGMYEHGVAAELARTPLSRGASLGVHESQSRMFENLIGRSRPFWQHYFPHFQAVFPEALEGIDAEMLYKAVNRVQPSLIRVEADEVTYNFHIMLRFELELAVLEGTLNVSELPEAWNAKMEQYLGVTPRSNAEGVLQDIHWSAGLIGYFPTYSLGNLLSVQLLEAAKAQDSAIEPGLRSGQYGPLLAWLQHHVHRHGRTLTPRELTERATGRSLSAEPYVRYLREKYQDIYALPQTALQP
ncbi:carboxypeptidase M32 [Deinococcus peraridilitoris]|uniref:Metal-dependent carboxypeptidase n=1 Tax=Deinococcus peraridilitoris (strain DSM 19664 / LMG 22246 / CIP 109416 / KR-200) TaxID=937777 RepID=L0A101_DEIPD|nr:carboxypeptidase M32 [Deinococcus peraridilitoris]AFZ66675.1 Zn-dependent carboxypeptidase [Deinococcus peraridilitoris DSM 19664]